MFLHVSSVFQFKQACFQQTNSEFVQARLRILKVAPVFTHPNLLKFKYKVDIQMPSWQLWKSSLMGAVLQLPDNSPWNLYISQVIQGNYW